MSTDRLGNRFAPTLSQEPRAPSRPALRHGAAGLFMNAQRDSDGRPGPSASGYPTACCMRHIARTDEYTVSLERLVSRAASAPAPVAAKP
jgi:hypothetical protein